MRVTAALCFAHWAAAGVTIWVTVAGLEEMHIRITWPLLWLIWMGCFGVGWSAVRLALKMPALRWRYLNLPENAGLFGFSRLKWSEMLAAHVIVGLLFHACTLIPGFVGGR